MLLSILQLILGLVLLSFGGEYLVRGATRIALWARISTTVVALTVVAMGTSLPELAVSVGAAMRNSTDIAFGNVVGSNIFNIGAILGIGAVLAVIPVSRQTVRVEYPFMFVISCIAFFLARDGVVDRLDGAFLLVLLGLFTTFVVYVSRRDVAAEEAGQLQEEVTRMARTDPERRPRWGSALGAIALGVTGLALGADQAVRGAVELARLWGVQERVIGLTVVAMGTSLPELVTTVAAIRQNQPEIALGNVIGSNIFNLLGILGTAAVLVTVPVNPDANRLDLLVMLAFSAIIFPMMFWGRSLNRRDGTLLLLGFALYMGYLLTHARVA